MATLIAPSDCDIYAHKSFKPVFDSATERGQNMLAKLTDDHRASFAWVQNPLLWVPFFQNHGKQCGQHAGYPLIHVLITDFTLG